MVSLKEDNIYGIKEGYNQVFKNQHTLSIGHKEIIKMRTVGEITDRDLIITKFLFNFTFATSLQVMEYLSIEHPEMSTSEIAIKSRLDKLVQYRVLNKFKLYEGELDPNKRYEDLTDDALEIYCMDLGGRYLLANFSNEETSNWYTVRTMKISEVIKRELYTTEFYIKLMKSSGPKIKFFNINPSMNIGRQEVIPSFEFCLDDNGKSLYYIGEIVLDIDIPVSLRSKVIRLESLLSTQGWKKYYYDADNPPPILLIAESDIVALDASKLMYNSTNLRAFRSSTIKRIDNPFQEAGVFMKYLDRVEELQPVISSKFQID